MQFTDQTYTSTHENECCFNQLKNSLQIFEHVCGIFKLFLCFFVVLHANRNNDFERHSILCRFDSTGHIRINKHLEERNDQHKLME